MQTTKERKPRTVKKCPILIEKRDDGSDAWVSCDLDAGLTDADALSDTDMVADTAGAKAWIREWGKTGETYRIISVRAQFKLSEKVTRKLGFEEVTP